MARLPAYAALRQALDDIATHAQAEGMTLGEFLDALHDMGATTPFADSCQHCQDPDDTGPWWPHAATRDGAWITGTYRCARGHQWTCGYAITITALL
jgi:hypothetical protein